MAALAYGAAITSNPKEQGTAFVAKVVFVTPAGDHVEVEAEVGASIMTAALVNDVDGIVGECGGGLVCGTCHGYVDQPFLEKVPPMRQDEDDLLEFASARHSNSRLCCQIVVSEDLNGMIVRLPTCQP